jgi:hypothetical protein
MLLMNSLAKLPKNIWNGFKSPILAIKLGSVLPISKGRIKLSSKESVLLASSPTPGIF